MMENLKVGLQKAGVYKDPDSAVYDGELKVRSQKAEEFISLPMVVLIYLKAQGRRNTNFFESFIHVFNIISTNQY